MFKTTRIAAASVLLALAGIAQATVPINFDPDGAGPAPAVNVMTFDWKPSSALAANGNPSGGLISGKKVTILTHAMLGALNDANGNIILLPAGTEVTFVGGFGESVNVDAGGNVSFAYDGTNSTNYFEIWVSTPDANNLTGTGFNNTKRILSGLVTDSSGNFTGGLPIQGLDQFLADNYPGVTTITGSGSTQISVNVISADPDYFPGFTPDVIDTVKLFFNTSTVTPYKQVDPSANFVGGPADFQGNNAPGSDVPANIGSVNGGLQQSGADLNFELQADANHSFEVGQVVAGACRVTYGGNDKNGNIDPNKFGSACMKVKGNQENCYTFGGQVGAPTANPALGGPFGEHTHHQVSGPAGDFVFRAGTHSAPKTTRITATACKDPGACRQAVANAGFKQIDFEGTGSFRTLDATAMAYLAAAAGHPVNPDNADAQIYYFRVDMDDTGEPGNKASKNKFDVLAATNFLKDDQNNPLSTPDPLLASYGACNTMADVYQFYICKDENRCERDSKDVIYQVRGFLTGGNIQLHQIIK